MPVSIHCLLHSTNTVMYLIRTKLPCSDKREKNNSASSKNIAQKASFRLKTKYKCVCECSQTFLHLENYHHKQVVALFLSELHCFNLAALQGFISSFGVSLLIIPKNNTIVCKVADRNSKDF